MPEDTPTGDSGAQADDERERLRRRASFDADARAYDRARPGYPDPLFDDLVALAGIPEHGSVLEIGSGTGKASLPLAQRGFQLVGIELGANMAAIARERLARFPNATIVVADFESHPLPEASFDAAISASAWHWIDPRVGFPKVARALKPGGALALLGNSRDRQAPATGRADQAEQRDQEAFQAAAEQIIRRYAPALLRRRERTPSERIPGERAEQPGMRPPDAPPSYRPR